MNRPFWQGRRVFVTGHTGFKGSWLTTWLQSLGAEVTGYALEPDTKPSLFEAAAVGRGMRSVVADIRDAESVRRELQNSKAEIVFHLAAQSLVRESYRRPVDTFATNVMGTAHVLEAARESGTVRAMVVVTSDKCYDNREWVWPYRESDPLGGRDPYSSSKACAELVAAAYRASFFEDVNTPAIATARAGNVIGGGDWAPDRLVPDLVRAFVAGTPAEVRNPEAVRPWQHVLEPLHGYLVLAENLLERREVADAWNFGPLDADVRPVREIADALAQRWGGSASWHSGSREGVHEAHTLKVDSSRARTILKWSPRLTIDDAVSWTVEWHRRFAEESGSGRAVTEEQIRRFEGLVA